MEGRVRSLRAEQARLSQVMRDNGCSWREVADEFVNRWRLTYLQAFRLVHGLSQEQAAERYNTKWHPDRPLIGKHISYWEMWPSKTGKEPPLGKLRMLAEVYECSLSDLLAESGSRGNMPGGDAQRRPLRDAGRGSNDQSLRISPGGQDGEMERRKVLQSLAVLGIPAGLPVVASARQPVFSRAASVPPEILDYFRAQLDGHYQADLLLGPHQLIGPVISQFQLLSHCAEIAVDGLRADLLRMGAAYTGFLTWLCQDAGNYQRALLWANETLELAHRAQDVQLVSHALVNKSMLYADLGGGQQAVELSEAALAASPGLCAKVRVQAMQQAAHGYSLIGDRARVDAFLDTASHLLAAVDDDYPWGNACRRSPVYLEAQRATCYGRMRVTREADRLWKQVISEMPRGFRRDKGVYLARWAVASADGGSPERAADLIREAAPLAAETRSARMRQELTAAWRHLGPWQQTTAGRDAAEVLASAGIDTERAGGS